MMMVGLRGAVEQLRVLLTHAARQGRGCVSAYSAAPQQRNAGDQTTVGDGTVDDRSYAVRNLERRAMKLEEQVRDLTELYQKAISDSEIVRKKTQKFVEDAKLFGIQSFCRDLVEVADILEDATEQATKAGIKDLSDILSAIDGKLQSVLIKHGLHKMTPVGGNYDPYDHEIVCHVPAEGRRPGSIATVSLDGYKLHGRTIRHAHVGIAVETHE
ncbi:grpE protein homolog 2, mitochondrial [Aquarana catesbeiana]|uniref:grpE protein homolog 2, mitochondrial n=1 Tax=Aquarana catesbeiana TaxID=8400 RepID=UPI003CCA2D94